MFSDVFFFFFSDCKGVDIRNLEKPRLVTRVSNMNTDRDAPQSLDIRTLRWRLKKQGCSDEKQRSETRVDPDLRERGTQEF